MGDVVYISDEIAKREWRRRNRDEDDVHKMLRDTLIGGLESVKSKLGTEDNSQLYFVSSACATKISFKGGVFNYADPQDFFPIEEGRLKDFFSEKAQEENTIGFICTSSKSITALSELKITKSTVGIAAGIVSYALVLI